MSIRKDRRAFGRMLTLLVAVPVATAVAGCQAIQGLVGTGGSAIGTAAGNAVATKLIATGQALIASLQTTITSAGVKVSSNVTNDITQAQTALTAISTAFGNNVFSNANTLAQNLSGGIVTAAQAALGFFTTNANVTSILNAVITYAPTIIDLGGALLGISAAPAANVQQARAAAKVTLGLVL
jgi:hypothetical protein